MFTPDQLIAALVIVPKPAGYTYNEMMLAILKKVMVRELAAKTVRYLVGKVQNGMKYA